MPSRYRCLSDYTLTPPHASIDAEDEPLHIYWLRLELSESPISLIGNECATSAVTRRSSADTHAGYFRWSRQIFYHVIFASRSVA